MNKETLAEYKNYLQIIPDRGSEAYLHKIATELMQERKATADLIKRMRESLKTVCVIHREVISPEFRDLMEEEITKANQWLKENNDEK